MPYRLRQARGDTLLKEAAALAARIASTSAVQRIYFAFPPLADTETVHWVHRLPFLTVEHSFTPLEGWWEITSLDKLAREQPTAYHFRTFRSYGIAPSSIVTIFSMMGSPSLDQERAPFFFLMWQHAFQNGWRFRKRGDSGFFEKDKPQLLHAASPLKSPPTRSLSFRPR